MKTYENKRYRSRCTAFEFKNQITPLLRHLMHFPAIVFIMKICVKLSCIEIFEYI